MFKRLFKKKEKINTKKLNNYLENKNPKKLISKYTSNKNKSVIYSKEGKKIVRVNKGIIKDLLKLSKSKKRKIETENYEIIKKKDTNNTTKTYIFIDKKNSKKYFIKEIKNNTLLLRLNGIQEYIGLDILNKYRLNIIEPKVAYKDKEKSYIMYNYTNLENIRNTKKLTEKQKREIQKIFIKIEKEINKNQIIKKKDFIQVHDIDTKNAYIDIKNKKIYLSDPFISGVNH